MFSNWSRFLPEGVEVCALLLPGRENRLKDQPIHQISPLIKILTSVMPSYLQTPFAFFGHSMGAIIGFELARSLREHYSIAPELMFVSACDAPQSPHRDLLISALPDPEFKEALRRIDGTPELVLQNDELMQLMLPTLRADFALCETYTYSAAPPLDCPIDAFCGINDSRLDKESMATWGNQTTGEFSLRMLPGNHFFLHSAQKSLLEHVSNDLRAILKKMD